MLKNLLRVWQLDFFALENIDQLATLLLAGINTKTDNFSSLQMKAETFSAIAEMLHLGARRLNLNTQAENKSTDKKTSKPVKKKSKSVVIK